MIQHDWKRWRRNDSPRLWCCVCCVHFQTRYTLVDLKGTKRNKKVLQTKKVLSFGSLREITNFSTFRTKALLNSWRNLWRLRGWRAYRPFVLLCAAYAEMHVWKFLFLLCLYRQTVSLVHVSLTCCPTGICCSRFHFIVINAATFKTPFFIQAPLTARAVHLFAFIQI